MNDQQLRAWWSHRQALDGRFSGKSAATVLAETGWARSVGGVSPYLTLFSRAGIRRETVDAAVSDLEIHELPSARGCTYVVPAQDFALALKVAQPFSGEGKTAEKLGVTAREIDKLCKGVVAVLEKESLDPNGLRDVLGPAVRNLGEEGKRKGLTTTLPVALDKLQAEGEIRRVPVNGRLDQQRYRYTPWRPNPLSRSKLTEEEANIELARRFFSWTGPASLDEFRWFSALAAKQAKAALEPLKLEAAGDRLLLPEHREAYEAFRAPAQPHYLLVSGLDGLFLLRRDLKSLLDPGDSIRKEIGGLTDLPSHAIVDRGRLVGLWEYDPGSESIVWMPFIQPDAALKEAVRRTEDFVRVQLGDARSFSLDSPKSRAPRIAALRAAGS